MSAAVSSRLRITLKAFDNDPIERFFKEIMNLAVKSGATIVGPIPLPARKKRFDVIRSPHVCRDSMDQVQITFYKQIFEIRNCTVNTIASLNSLELRYAVEANIKELPERS